MIEADTTADNFLRVGSEQGIEDSRHPAFLLVLGKKYDTVELL